MSARLWWPVLAIGIALVVLPLAIGLPSKASHGQSMIDEFNPIMQPANVETTVDYYNETFVPLRPVAEGGIAAGAEAPELIGALAQQLGMSPAQVQQFLGAEFPATAQLLGNLPKLEPVFEGVPPGLDHYQPLVNTMDNNVTNYEKIDSLPNFRLFMWFFIAPGLLLVLLSGRALLAARSVVPGRTVPATA